MTMKFVYKITLTFIAPIVITLGIWGWLSYRTMERKIHADTDLILTSYTDAIISRVLSGEELPPRFNGAYNTYYIREVPESYALSVPAITYSEAEAYLKSQEDFASSRVRKQIFMGGDGRYHEITVSLPTFEQEVLVNHVLVWSVILFSALLVAMLAISVIVVNYNMKPFHALMKWMDGYVPGKKGTAAPADTDIIEFRRLAATAQKAVDRFEKEYEERKVFIGNVTHELQTPLAVCSSRVEMLLNREDLDETVALELAKIHRSIQHVIRLNKTLLLLTKIEHGQFPDKSDTDIVSMLKDNVDIYQEMYEYKNIDVQFNVSSGLKIMMNEKMASVLVSNLVKNAFIHSPEGSSVRIEVSSDGFEVRNPGEAALDSGQLFRRFYQPGGRKSGSTGLGLALANAVCGYSGLDLSYSFEGDSHLFSVRLVK